jgi:hypothetical protein
VGDDEVGDPALVVQVEAGQADLGQRVAVGLVAGDRHDARVLAAQGQAAAGAAEYLDLVVGLALEALDQHQVDRAHAGDQVLDVGCSPDVTMTSVAPAWRCW